MQAELQHQHQKLGMTKSLDPGMEILTAPSKTQEGHAVRFRLKLKQLSSSSFSNSSLDGNSPKTRSRRGLGSSKVFRSSFENFDFMRVFLRHPQNFLQIFA